MWLIGRDGELARLAEPATDSAALELDVRAAKALAEKGIRPPGVNVAHQKIRSAAVVLPPDQAFKDAAAEALKVRPGVRQTSV